MVVAAGPFAPGHLGELTQIVPFEMVDAVLESTRTVQARVRALPSRVVVYLRISRWYWSSASIIAPTFTGADSTPLLEYRHRVHGRRNVTGHKSALPDKGFPHPLLWHARARAGIVKLSNQTWI